MKHIGRELGVAVGVIILVLLFGAVVAGSVLAAVDPGAESAPGLSLVAFLRWAGTGPGISLIIGVALSFVVEWFPGYAGLVPRVKRLGMLLVSFIIPVVALVLLVLLQEVVFSWNAVYLALAAGFAEFYGSQIAHARRLAVVPVPDRPTFEEEGKAIFGD